MNEVTAQLITYKNKVDAHMVKQDTSKIHLSLQTGEILCYCLMKCEITDGQYIWEHKLTYRPTSSSSKIPCCHTNFQINKTKTKTFSNLTVRLDKENKNHFIFQNLLASRGALPLLGVKFALLSNQDWQSRVDMLCSLRFLQYYMTIMWCDLRKPVTWWKLSNLSYWYHMKVCIILFSELFAWAFCGTGIKSYWCSKVVKNNEKH